MRKKFLAILLAVAFTMSGCGSVAQDDSAEKAAELQSQVDDLQSQLKEINKQIDEMESAPVSQEPADTQEVVDNQGGVQEQASEEIEKEEVAEEVADGDEVEAAISKMGPINNEFYADDGTTVSIIGVRTDNSWVIFDIAASNNNPDNKRFTGFIQIVTINGLRCGDVFGGSFADRLMSGDTAETEVKLEKKKVITLAKSAGFDSLYDFPIEKIGFEFYAYYGDVPVEDNRLYAEINTSLYDESTFSSMYGEKIGTVEYKGHELIEYIKKDGSQVKSIFLINEGEAFVFNPKVKINEYDAGWGVFNDGIKYYYNFSSEGTTRLTPISGFAVTFEDDIDTIRKTYEISNDETVNIKVGGITVYSY